MSNIWKPLEDKLNKKFGNDWYDVLKDKHNDDHEYCVNFNFNNEIVPKVHYDICINNDNKLVIIYADIFIEVNDDSTITLSANNLEQFKNIYSNLIDTKNNIIEINMTVYDIANENNFRVKEIL